MMLIASCITLKWPRLKCSLYLHRGYAHLNVVCYVPLGLVALHDQLLLSIASKGQTLHYHGQSSANIQKQEQDASTQSRGSTCLYTRETKCLCGCEKILWNKNLLACSLAILKACTQATSTPPLADLSIASPRALFFRFCKLKLWNLKAWGRIVP